MFFLGLIAVVSSLFVITNEDLARKQDEINQKGYAYRTGPIRIYDESLTEVPKLHILPINTSAEDKSVCIVTYSSLNPPYNHLPSLLFKTLQTRFKGHLLYQKGGWPNAHAGCLRHALAGYGFKVCAIQEAFDLGYKKVLWLDSIIEVNKDLAPLFRFLDTHPCLYRYSGFPFKNYVNNALTNEFKLSNTQVGRYRHIASGVLGFNFNYPDCHKALKIWHDTTDKKLDWPKNFPEQLLISIIFSKLGLDKCAYGPKLLKIHNHDPKDCILQLRSKRKID